MIAMTRREGVTLVEVLVAIFVMGIGLLSLMALFPLGAQNMAQAIKDDRTAHACANAHAVAKMWDLGNDPAVQKGMTMQADDVTPRPPPDTNGPSYPVYVDPFGCNQLPAPAWLGNSSFNIRRIKPDFITNSANPTFPRSIPRWFSLLDDVSFGDNGLATSPVDRAGRYQWAFLCRQTKYDTAYTKPVEVTTVVYDRRSLLSIGVGVLDGESAFPANFDSTTNVATLLWAAGTDPPNLRTGKWIFDASDPTATHGYFYRVVHVTEPGSAGANSMDVELQNNPRSSASPTPSGNGRAIVMESVAEVFEMGTN